MYAVMYKVNLKVITKDDTLRLKYKITSDSKISISLTSLGYITHIPLYLISLQYI